MERNCEACKYYVTSKDGKTKGCSQWICENFTVTTEECIEIFEGMKKGVFPWLIDPYCDKAISALKQYDGMTNGEVIQALFPKIHPCDHEQYISIYSQGSDDFFNHCQFDPKWWNAPYKAESEDI